MNVHHPIANESRGIAAGVKVAVVVVIVGVLAVLADRKPVTPAEVSDHTATVAPVAATAPAPEGFAVPRELRANAGEVPAPVETF